jgi:hypothetical protein
VTSFFTEMFGTTVRYTSISMMFQGGAVVFASTPPVIATALLAVFGSWLAVAIYMAAAAAVSVTGALASREGRGTDLTRTDGAATSAQRNQPMHVTSTGGN